MVLEKTRSSSVIQWRRYTLHSHYKKIGKQRIYLSKPPFSPKENTAREPFKATKNIAGKMHPSIQLMRVSRDGGNPIASSISCTKSRHRENHCLGCI